VLSVVIHPGNGLKEIDLQFEEKETMAL